MVNLALEVFQMAVIHTINLRLTDAIKSLEKKVGKVGWFADAKYPTGEYVAEIAAQNEFGNPNKHIPPRPFMRPTIEAKQTEWLDLAARGTRSVLLGKRTIDDVMESISARAAGQIAKTISLLTEPPLSEVTIQKRREARKGKKIRQAALEKPLIDTRHMYNSLINKVEDA